jgi:hypothetical protein
MSDAGDHLRVTWDDYHRAIEELAVRVHDSGWRFDQVLALARGGLRVGDVFSRVFDVPLAILSTSSYRKEAGTERGALDIARHITMPVGSLAGKVLLIDDLVDSGITLGNVQQHLMKNFPQVTEVKSAVIWYKACSTVRPDFYLRYLPDNPWVHQPFEVYDGLSVEELKERLKK